MEINFLSDKMCRGATHSQVVQLLRSSGPHPILIVSSLPAPYEAAGYGTLPRSLDAASAATETRRNVGAFKEKVMIVAILEISWHCLCMINVDGRNLEC